VAEAVVGGDPPDLDTQEDAERLVVQWAPVAGADGYAVTLRDTTGGITVAQQNVPPNAWIAYTGLHLQPGVTYQAAVSAFRAATVLGEDTSYAPVVLSDGITIDDVSPPVIESFTAAVAPGVSLDLAGSIRDRTRLASWSLALVCDGVTHWEQTTPVTTAHVTFAVQVVPPDLPLWGSCAVTLRAVDTAGHAATATRTFLLCPEGQFASGDTCVSSPSDVPDVPGHKAPGCRGSAAGSPSGVSAWGLLVGLAVLAVRRRSGRRKRAVE